MVVGVIGFDRDHLGRWSRLDAIKCIRFNQKFDQRWINFCEKEGNMRGGEVLRKLEMKREGWRGRGFGVSRFIYIYYMVVSVILGFKI